MGRFDHKRLDVYGDAIEFVRGADPIIRRIPRNRRRLADQLVRATVSIPLNIAEGAGEYSRREKARFYRMARRSAAECAAILDVAVAWGLLEEEMATRHEDLLGRIAARLTNLARTLERDQRAKAAGSGRSPSPSPSPSPKRQ